MVISKAELVSLGWESNSSKDEIIYSDICSDSRKVEKGSIFFAFDGTRALGKDFVVQSIDNGAQAVFIDIKYREDLRNIISKGNKTPVYFSSDFLRQSGKLISYLYGRPSEKLNCVAVTGTNGKTTIAWTIFKILRNLGEKSSYIGTIGIELPNSSNVAALTTPPVIEIQKLLFQTLKDGGSYAVLESSSHGLNQGRLAGVKWNLGLFTNLTEDHRDYHGDMEHYYLSKRILFENLLEQKDSSGAIINVDDPYGKKLHDWIKEVNPDFKCIGLGIKGDFKIEEISPDWRGYGAIINYNSNKYKLKSRLIGNFNIYNLSMVFASLLFLGFDADDILNEMGSIEGAPGRMEVYHLKNGAMVVVDYAHTPDALKKALETLRELKPQKLAVVFGCGGDRDKEKRSQMGEIAENFADEVVITNDNPRTEKPEIIIREIESGMKKKNYTVIEDRRQAIEETALKLRKGEVVLIAGKGHEDYQILPEGRIYFSDRDIALELTETIPPVFDILPENEK